MHEGVCGGTREDANNLCGLVAGYIHHPYVAGATVLILRCQNSQLKFSTNRSPGVIRIFSEPMFVFEQQQSGSEFKMLSESIRSTFSGLMEANKSRPAPASLSLVRGFELRRLGWVFDIPANPAVGRVGDGWQLLGGGACSPNFLNSAASHRN